MIDFAALKRANGPLAAVLDWDEESTGGAGALAGLTAGIKANIAVRGMPFHAGIAGLKDRMAEQDAEVVRRLREAGAQILGILNMEEAALGSKTDNPHFGATQNPHRPGFSPGGSSGGSGAAVAAGLCDFALGTDTMGSIRIPAAHCGVYGFKPATSRVSQDGLEPADPSLDAIGPLARDLDMLERVAWVISDLGPSIADFGGVTLADHGVEIRGDVAGRFAASLDALPRRPATAKLSTPSRRIRFAGFIHVARFMSRHLETVTGKSDHLVKLLAYGPNRHADDWAEDLAILARTRNEVRDLVERHGFLILPTAPNLPFAHGDPEPAAQADFTCLANIAGLPALSLPAGWSEDGLPIGVQIVGREGFEAGLFALARHLDTKLDAYRAPFEQGE